MYKRKKATVVSVKKIMWSASEGLLTSALPLNPTGALAEPKNVPGGTDVLGKRKSVPGKIRIRASI